MHRPPHFGVLDPPGECCDDVARDFVLHLEQCANLTIEALRPEMVSGSGVDQLRGYAHPRVGASDAAFHDISHAKLAADLFGVDILPPVMKGRITCNDKQLTEP